MVLSAYDEHPNAFDDNSGIAESANGVPDILDEVKWPLDWLVRMQNSDGSLLCVQGLAEASPPSSATGPSYYGPATTAATLMGAAAFAYGAKIFSTRSEANLKTYGDDLSARAKEHGIGRMPTPMSHITTMMMQSSQAQADSLRASRRWMIWVAYLQN